MPHLKMRGLAASSCLSIVVLLAGCSSNPTADTTAAIATPASAQPAVPAPPPVPAVALLTCDQLKGEIETLKAAKVPDRLADFGKSKYKPTPDELVRFTRYVEVKEATAANCETASKVKTKKKKDKVAAVTTKTTGAKAAIAPATAETKASKPETVTASAGDATPAPEPTKAVVVTPASVEDPAGGITTTIPVEDGSG